MSDSNKWYTLKILIIICLIYFVNHITRDLKDLIEKKQGKLMAKATHTLRPEENVVVARNTKATTPKLLKRTKRKPLPIDERKMVFRKVKSLTQCVDSPISSKIQQRGDYWVLYNYIPARKKFKCEKSVTYTTHCDFTFLENLVTLVQRWKAPISTAIYAPGKDLEPTLESIIFLRECTISLIKDYVTFHIFFDNEQVPKKIPSLKNILRKRVNCSQIPPYQNTNSNRTPNKVENQELIYPVNVARNIAKEMAGTHFILASDIELYPSLDIPEKFLKLIASNEGVLKRRGPKVFPLHIFEVAENTTVPRNKTELQKMLAENQAIPFHQMVCKECHRIPRTKEWIGANETNELHVFHVAKRIGRYGFWEPIYIGTRDDPSYDERLSWEGKRDKMTQGYIMCAMEYNFLILDNAFLVHKPGIKLFTEDPKREALVEDQSLLIKETIFPEITALFGNNPDCLI